MQWLGFVDENETPKVLVPLPFDMNTTPYTTAMTLPGHVIVVVLSPMRLDTSCPDHNAHAIRKEYLICCLNARCF